MPTNEELERKLEIRERNYNELLGTVETLNRVNDALAADLIDAIQERHWTRAEFDTMHKRLEGVEGENERLRVELEKAQGEGSEDLEDLENLVNIANRHFYDDYVYNIAIIGRYAPENATFSEFVKEYVSGDERFEAIGVSRDWFVRFFREKLEAAYEADKERYAEEKAEGEEGEDD